MSYLLAQASAHRIPLRDGSVQTCVTSPPYWGLRAYAGEQTFSWGGDVGHAHEWGGERIATAGRNDSGEQREGFHGQAAGYGGARNVSQGSFCPCGAWRGALGLEPTPELYVEHMVEVFREVRRVLRKDGTLWLNLGDSYASSAVGFGNSGGSYESERDWGDVPREKRAIPRDLKPKDLVGIPWRVAFALQADGWWLRSDIIWAKPNPMPESVTDRPTKSHEYLFLLTKSSSYYYDADAIREENSPLTIAIHSGRERRTHSHPASDGRIDGQAPHRGGLNVNGDSALTTGGRNARSVWTIATQPYPGAHYAVFPEELPERCIKAGSRPAGNRCDCAEVIETPIGDGGGVDPTLTTGRAGFNRERGDEGARPITRGAQRDYATQLRASPHRASMSAEAGPAFEHYVRTDRSGARPPAQALLDDWTARGWLVEPVACRCADAPGDIVLDPFNGSGTTGAVALRLGRRYVGLDLSREYLSEQALRRVDPLAAAAQDARTGASGQQVMAL